MLGTGISGPATTRLGIDKALASIQAAIDAAIGEAGLSAAGLAGIHAGIGLAGIGRKGALEALTAMPHPFACIAFVERRR